jgi:hypothetical protein
MLAHARGAPHFVYGVKYDGVFHGGRWKGGLENVEIGQGAALWEDYGVFFEAMAAALTLVVGASTRLHRWMWPPAFLISFSSFLYRIESEVHQDTPLSFTFPHLAKEVLRRVGANATCDFKAQLSVIAAVRVPAGGAGLMSLVYDCAAPGCLRRDNLDYATGTVAVFPSGVFHSSAGRPQVHSKSLKSVL